MEPVDFSGRSIYGRAYDELLRHGKNLQTLGYRESSKTPNVFWRPGPDGIVFFANMRGNEHVAIWDDTRPLFGWKSSESFACDHEHTGAHHVDGTPCPQTFRLREIMKGEIRRLAHARVPCRLSFFETSEPEGIFFGDTTSACPDCGTDLLQGEAHDAECPTHLTKASARPA